MEQTLSLLFPMNPPPPPPLKLFLKIPKKYALVAGTERIAPSCLKFRDAVPNIKFGTSRTTNFIFHNKKKFFGIGD